MTIQTPVSRQELLSRADKLKGRSLRQVAQSVDMPVPSSTEHAKGWAGGLIEVALGADAGNAPAPDFIQLGIELKTIPVDEKGQPKESTYICVVQLDADELKDWETSLVKTKLSTVLWIPIEGNKQIPLASRLIGNPVLWQPNEEQEHQLRHDWRELCDMIVIGDIDKISASMGEYLQIRPKAADSKSLTRDKNQSGNAGLTLPRGFYLRPSFTQSIISAVT